MTSKERHRKDRGGNAYGQGVRSLPLLQQAVAGVLRKVLTLWVVSTTIDRLYGLRPKTNMLSTIDGFDNFSFWRQYKPRSMFVKSPTFNKIKFEWVYKWVWLLFY